MAFVTLIHHLGLGDHVMLNGLARTLEKKGHQVHVIVMGHQADSIRFMYRDTTIKVLVTPSKNPADIRKLIVGTPFNLATYGIPDDIWSAVTFSGALGTWAHVPYFQASINPEYMRTHFKLVRDPVREQELFDRLCLPSEYIFEHKDPIHKDFGLVSDFPIINPSTIENPYNIFDWLLVIEKAREVHCANGGPFMWMIELLKLGGPHKNFFHISAAHGEYLPQCVKNVFTDDIWTFKD